jgi:uncharacterized low-complexity protein
MSNKAAIKHLAVALGTVFTVTLAHSTNAAENPFTMQPLSSGYMMLAEGKCGEGKCGTAKGSEGKCGMGRMDTDGDGNVTREEFMKGHEAMFDKIDTNGDGVIDEAERAAQMAKMKGFMQGGKCGEGKCGSSK